MGPTGHRQLQHGKETTNEPLYFATDGGSVRPWRGCTRLPGAGIVLNCESDVDFCDCNLKVESAFGGGGELTDSDVYTIKLTTPCDVADSVEAGLDALSEAKECFVTDSLNDDGATADARAS